MVNYDNGKVYIIRSPNTDKVYIGSTTLTLSQRMAEHRRITRYYTMGNGMGRGGCPRSSTILDAGGAYIELLEEVHCKTRAELLAREGYHMRAFVNHIVNLQIAGRDDATRREELRKYERARGRVYDARRRARKRGEELPPLPEKNPLLPPDS